MNEITKNKNQKQTTVVNTWNGKTYLMNELGVEIVRLFRQGLKSKTIAQVIESRLDTRGIQANFDLQAETDKIVNNLIKGGFTPINTRILTSDDDTPPLIFLQIDISWACNLRCKHCYLSNTLKEQHHPRADFHPLSSSEWKRVIDQALEMNVPKMSVLGGEPMLSDMFFDLSKYASDKGFRLYTTTNGTLVTPDVAKKFRNAGYRDIDVSLDGATVEEHEFLRGKNTFNKTVRGIENLVAAGVEVKAACVLHKKNSGNLPVLFNFGKQLGVKHIYLNSILPGGEGQEIFDDISLTTDDWKKILKVVDAWNASGNTPRVFAEPRFIFDRIHAKEEVSDQSIVYSGCKGGKRELTLTPDGYAIACSLFSNEKRFYTSNIREKTLKEIWKEDYWVNEFRKINKSNLCSDCQNCKYVDKCIGGCHASALLKTGSLYNKDPKCDIRF